MVVKLEIESCPCLNMDTKPKHLYFVLYEWWTRNSMSYAYIFGVAQFNEVNADIHRHREYKIASAKPEVQLSVLLHEIETKVQVLVFDCYKLFFITAWDAMTTTIVIHRSTCGRHYSVFIFVQCEPHTNWTSESRESAVVGNIRFTLGISFIIYITRDTSVFGLAAAILYFRRRSMSAWTEVGDPENIGVTAGISSLLFTQHDIHYFRFGGNEPKSSGNQTGS